MRTFILKAGNKVNVVKADGTFVHNYMTKKDIPMTLKGMGHIERNGMDFDTWNVDGYTLEFWFSQLTETTPCTCNGKGVWEEGMYGRVKGMKWKTKCGPQCTFVKR
jgi:hypothetical protein